MVEFPVQSLVISWEKLGMLREVMRTWTGFPKKQGTFIPDVSPRTVTLFSSPGQIERNFVRLIPFPSCVHKKFLQIWLIF